MRRSTLGLGILLGLASLAVTGAAAAVVPSVFGRDTGPLAGVATQAAFDAPSLARAPGARRSPASARGGGPFRPGYRRVSRKRVQPPKRSPYETLKLSGLITLRGDSQRLTIHWARTDDRPLGIRFHGVERIRAAAELRKLPVAERLVRAREAFGLTPGQVELLERAASERAEAGADVAEAGQFQRRVAEALNDEQRRRWEDEGYGDSFHEPVHVSFGNVRVAAESFVLDAKPVTATSVTLTLDPGICHEERP